MTESECYQSLGKLTKTRAAWEANIPYVASLLSCESVRIRAKALWLLGEMGLACPASIEAHVPAIAAFRNNAEPLLRERAVNALGRIGRSNFPAIEPFFNDLFRFACDENANVRLCFIWASENIATNTPEPFRERLPLYAELFHDENDRVRMEAPELFRVLGKRRPDFVQPYLEQLRRIADADSNRVVRLHCLGAIKAAEQQSEQNL